VVFTDKFLGSTRALLGKVQVAPPEGIAYALYIIKVVLIVVTSFLGALMLLLGVVVRRQGLIKKSASTRAGVCGLQGVGRSAAGSATAIAMAHGSCNSNS
jgi:hypothetical protein